MIAGLLALVVAAAFTGAAFYINFAEHPARMTLEPVSAVRQWRPSYKRGFTMQAALAVAGGGLALWQWWQTGGTPWLAGGLLLLANWPFTLLVLLPVNLRLLDISADALPDLAKLLQQWNRLHAVRTLLGALSLVCLFLGALG